MSFESTKEKLEELMNYKKEIGKYHPEKLFRKITASLDHMIETLECMDAGNSVVVGENDREIVFRSSNMILDTVKDRRMTEWYRDFSLAYAKMLGNYDDNVIGDGRLKRKAQVIKRLVNSNYALRDLIKMAKEMKRLDRNREATRLAKHYLDSLNEENKER